MTIEEFCEKYELSLYRLAQVLNIEKTSTYRWKKKERRLPTWINKYLDLQDYYYLQNGKFLE